MAVSNSGSKSAQPMTLELTPNGPPLFRDPRPFTVGSTPARTMLLPNPSVTAGAIRTWLADGNFSKPDDLKRIKVEGPLYRIGDSFFFPAPANALWLPRSSCVKVALPDPTALNCTDIPGGLVPTEGSDKRQDVECLWSWDLVERWLSCKAIREHITADDLKANGFSPEIDSRVHVAIDSQRGCAEAGFLFGTEGSSFLRMSNGFEEGRFSVRVTSDLPTPSAGFVRLGGEGRFVSLAKGAEWPAMPDGVANAVKASGRLALYLVTPGVFKNGWTPVLPSTPQGATAAAGSGLLQRLAELKLVSAVVPRWKPLSGWDMQTRKQKALRRMVPAGAAYFFEGPSEPLLSLAKDLWLKSVCENEQDQLDGFGIVLCGSWEYRS